MFNCTIYELVKLISKTVFWTALFASIIRRHTFFPDMDHLLTSDTRETFSPWELGLPEYYSVGDKWKSVQGIFLTVLTNERRIQLFEIEL